MPNDAGSRVADTLREQLTRLLVGENTDLVDYGTDLDPALKELCETVNQLVMSFNDARNFIQSLAEGKLKVTPPARNLLASPFKQLQANLLHLTWQTKQIAAGDFSQRVFFMGDFATAFNSMVETLEEKSCVEHSLELREKQLAESQRIAHIGSWEHNLTTGEVVWSDELFHILGLDPRKDPADIKTFFDMIHPDDRPTLKTAIDESVKTGKHFSIDCRVNLRDGRIRILHAQAELRRDETGMQIILTGTGQDITEHKEAEDKVRQSETKYRNLFESSTDGIFIVDLDGNLIDVNSTAYIRLGFTKEELLRLHISKIDHPAFASQVSERMAQICEQGVAVFESAHLRKDGTTMPVEVNSRLIEYEGSTVYSSVIRDITARKQAEEERQENLLFIETLLENAPVGIRVFDGESGKCLLANKVTADIAGGYIEAMQRQNFRELVSWQVSGLLEVAEAVLADGCTRTVETDMLTSFGKQSSVAYIISKFIVRERPHFLVIGRDTAVEKQLVDKTKKMEARMLHAQKLESLGILAGGIAHDFNNILQSIIGNVELALMRLAPETPVRNNLQQIEKAAQRAAELAKQMLAYSGKGLFIIERLDINDLITEMNNILEVSISKKAVMRLNLAKDLPAFEGDATQIRQIIMNLVINASEAIGDKSGVIAITTGSMVCDQAYLSRIWLYDKLEEEDYIYLEIADTGCGMDKDTLEKIFDPFFTTKFTGRGLGMAAVLGIVRGHHGAITVYSEPGKGTTFKVLLPAMHDISVISLPESTSIKPLMGAGTILLVDDEETIRDLGKDMLEELGYSILTAENGVIALEVFKDHKEEIVCVILDLTMPLLDGEQTFRELQHLDPNVRVIISSGYNEQEVTQKFVGKKLAGFIQKPFKLVDLSRKLQKVLKGI